MSRAGPVPARRAPLEDVLRAQVEPIRRALHRLIDGPDLDDVAQQVLVEVACAYPSFRGDCAVGTWVHRIACRTAWAHLRRGRRVLPFADLGERLASGVPDPEQAARARDIHALVLDLSPDLRMAFVMHDVDGYSAREIAQILGIPEGTVHWRLREARLALRAALADGEAP